MNVKKVFINGFCMFVDLQIKISFKKSIIPLLSMTQKHIFLNV